MGKSISVCKCGWQLPKATGFSIMYACEQDVETITLTMQCPLCETLLEIDKFDTLNIN